MTKKKQIINTQNNVNAQEPSSAEMKKAPEPLWKDLLGLLVKIAIILLVLLLLFTFVFGIHSHSGNSMSPSVNDRDLLIYYRFDRSFSAGKAVVYEHDGEILVGRIIAVEGDTVDVTEEGLKINGYLQQNHKSVGETLAFENGISYPLKIQQGEVFILGDNRQQSADSRLFGTVSESSIKGSVITVIRRRDI
ncbi:MAG: signal peptidase I [Clostridia bacterium]|nr:signal peptidase I [Clostridia bacterium]MBR2175791.1 signal peptidase I [Clostridia bacterium]